MAVTESIAVGPTTPPLVELTMGGLLQRAAAAVPDRVALVAGVDDPAMRREWTYAGLYAESLRAARALRRRFEPGERVAIWAHNVPQWVVLEFAAAIAGVVVVTINPALRAAEVEYVLQQSRAAGVATEESFRGNPMRQTAHQLKERCSALREVIVLDDWEAFLAEGDAGIALPEVAPGDPAMIQYTSGTTGFPKGAMLHHRGLVNNAIGTLDRMGAGDAPVWVGTMPLFHTGGCGLAVLGVVANMGTQVLVDAFEPGLVLDLIHRYRANAMVGVPTMLIAMLEHPNFERTDFSRLRGICCGGSTVPPELVTRLEARLGAPFTIVYGQTECSPVATMTYPSDTLADKAGTIGRAMPHVEMKVADPVSGRALSTGQTGELCTRGYHVMLGYFEMPEATQAAIDGEGWLHTGDLGAMDERGFFTISGRLKDMIIRGGENIYPREIEDVLFKHPAVAEVAVLGVPEARWGEEVAAFVRPRAGAAVNRDELHAYVREHVAPHKAPRHWFVVDALPLTGSGKVQKFKLREAWERGEFTPL